MRVLHVTSSMSPTWGGPSRAIASLTNSVEKLGVQCTVFACEGSRLGTGSVDIDSSEISLFKTNILSRVWTGYSPSLKQALNEAVRTHDIVHIHELWHFPHYAAYKSAIANGKPYCITTHGTLSPWALRHKYARKRIYMQSIQRRILSHASCLHALTAQEKCDIKNLGILTPTVTIPNGIYTETLKNNPNNKIILGRYPHLKDKPIILFLGRIHPIKGLPLLAEAFSKLVAHIPEAHLVIAGPDENTHSKYIRSLLSKSGSLDKVIFTGMLTEVEKIDALNQAKMLVIPSLSEGMPISALEAMACSLPVVLTEDCQFPEVSRNKAGIVVNRNSSDLLNAMVNILNNPQEALKMGNNGYQLVNSKYHWDNISPQFLEMYHGILKQ